MHACMQSLPITLFCIHYLGFGIFGVVVNEGIHRVSIVCEKKRCPKVVETRNVDAKGKIYKAYP